jgi:hypothetical protein
VPTPWHFSPYSRSRQSANSRLLYHLAVRILSQSDRNGKAKEIGFDSLARIELTRAQSAGLRRIAVL